MSEPLLSVRDLKTQFFTEDGTVRAVDGISFDVHEGEIVGLVGESGAGKSVATSSILRLVDSPGEIVGGEIEFKGETIFGLEEGDDGELRPRDEMLTEEEMRKRIRGREIAIIFQDPMESLNPVFTVGGQLREFIEINRDLGAEEAKEEAIDMLREVGIPAPESRYDEYPHQFSGGMRQRVLIAMALACQPDLIIADEPTTALDVTVEGEILEMVTELQAERGTSFIWVTHDMSVVAEMCDRVCVMYAGEVVERGTLDSVFEDTVHPYTQGLLGSIPDVDDPRARLEPITGNVPSLIDAEMDDRCYFADRCPKAMESCLEKPAELTVDADADHGAKCVLADREHDPADALPDDYFGGGGEAADPDDGAAAATDGGER
ncbi:ABC transporter ATP-binding protein [Halorubrum distributum]|nr:ABC transporter ATP-binding protein [Halorubrum distributum]